MERYERRLSSEFDSVALGDQRLDRRLIQIADALADRPSESFPKACGGDAELEATYRFLRNERVTPEAILAPHFRSAALRAAQHETVLVVHDTTEFEFSGVAVREGLGRLIRPGQGFFGHFSLAIAPDGAEPLGLLALETLFRYRKPIPKAVKTRKENRLGEAERWSRGIETSEAQLRSLGSRAIHIMDREGDSYSLLAQSCESEVDFVVRAQHDRQLLESGVDATRLREAARNGNVMLEREVVLSPRRAYPGPKGKQHPVRRSRIARFKIAANAVQLRRPQSADASFPAGLPVNVVHVTEIDVPEGEQPVEWILLTTLPVDTPEDIAFIVDCYRARWLIEEYFKALKTGCQYERRQLESRQTLLNALAIYAPIAWRLLLTRHLARTSSERPAADALTTTQLKVLRAISKKPLEAKPTVREAMLAIARLGGHIRNNGDPGWQVLGRGMHDLLLMEMGWRARDPC